LKESLLGRIIYYVIAETTGLADPIFIQSLFSPHIYLDGIITLVDAKHGSIHLQHIGNPEKMKSLSSCCMLTRLDKVLLNKIDLVEENQITQIKNKIKAKFQQLSIIANLDEIMNIN